jgi:hypothetical protein
MFYRLLHDYILLLRVGNADVTQTFLWSGYGLLSTGCLACIGRLSSAGSPTGFTCAPDHPDTPDVQQQQCHRLVFVIEGNVYKYDLSFGVQCGLLIRQIRYSRLA